MNPEVVHKYFVFVHKDFVVRMGFVEVVEAVGMDIEVVLDY